MRILRLVCIFLTLLSGASSVPAQEKITVFAAASLTEVLTEIGKAHTQRTGQEVLLSFAGTGTLARQIEAGAPVDIFVGADHLWMDYLLKRGLVREETIKNLASNTLVVAGSADQPPLSLTKESILSRLSKDRLAVADPQTVPAGRYAKQALSALNLWPAVSQKLAPMENVRIALKAIERGETPLGIVYGSDIQATAKVKMLATFPADSHDPILYPVAQTLSGNAIAEGFFKFLFSPEAQKKLKQKGFLIMQGDG